MTPSRHHSPADIESHATGLLAVARGRLAARRDPWGFQHRVAVGRVANPERLHRGLDDRVDQPVVLRHLRRHEKVALDVALHLFDRPAGVLGVDADDDLPKPEDLTGMDLDVSGLAMPHTATRLVE